MTTLDDNILRRVAPRVAGTKGERQVKIVAALRGGVLQDTLTNTNP